MTRHHFPHDDGNKPVTDLADLLHAAPAQVPLTVAVLAANVLVFVAMLANGAGLWHTDTAVPLQWGANFGPATQDGQWWRLGSALFLHFGIVHLALNMWALWDVGRLIERVFGRWRFAVLYLGSGVLGNLLSLAWQGNQAVSGGASGAIFSLYGALLVFLLRERAHVDRGQFRWLFGASSAFIVLALVMGLLVPGIDNAAHLGGLVAGALFALVLAPHRSLGNTRPRAARAAAATALVAAVVVLVAQLPEPRYRLGEELRAREAISRFLAQDQRISAQWESLLGQGQRRQLSFDQLAGDIDDKVTAPYQQSFEQLSNLHLDPGAPSAQALESLRAYAARRSDAAQAMAEGLRVRDPEQFRKALESARQAPGMVARDASAAAASAPSPARDAAQRDPQPRR